MSKNRSEKRSAFGVGYVSMMIIFVIICLTIFAVMSLLAAQSNDRLNRRAGDFAEEYYAADSAAKATLAQLDGLAAAAMESGFFEEEFLDAAAEIDGAVAERVREGVSVSFTEQINDRQELSVKITFYGSSDSAERYIITQWRSRLIDTEESSGSLNVWDGGDIGLT